MKSYVALLRRLLGDGPKPPAPPAVRSDFAHLPVIRGEAELTPGEAPKRITAVPVSKLSPSEALRCFGVVQAAA